MSRTAKESVLAATPAVGTAPLRCSVVICAHADERFEDTVRAIRSVLDQTPAAHQVTVVVDHNEGLRGRLAERFPTVVVTPNAHARGLSGARNTGAQLATGDIVAFLDDDAVAQDGWLTALAEPYSDPEVIGVGGRTDPGWATGRPVWFPTEFDWVVGCTYTGRKPGVVRNLLGGNASYRRELFDDAGFAQNIGRSAEYSRPFACEDTEFCIRANQARPDGTFVYESRAVIVHKVPPAREKFAYFRTRCYAEGLSKGLVTQSVGFNDGLSTERRYSAVTLPAGVLRGVRGAARGDWHAVLGAGAIIVGLAYTAAGYGVAVARQMYERTRGAS